MKNWWLSFKTDFEFRVLSSWKRLIKFFGICIVPIIYAIICIVAFWNPIPNIGKASMAFLDEDAKKTLIIKEKDLTQVVTSKFYVVDDSKIIVDENVYGKFGEENFKYKNWFHDNNGKSVTVLNDSTSSITIDENLYSIKYFNTWDLFKNVLTKQDITRQDTETKFSVSINAAGQSIDFNNISYLKNDDAKNAFKDKKYYVQFLIKENFLQTILVNLSNVLTFDSLNPSFDYKDIPSIDMWSTFSHNFIFGYYLNTVGEFKSALLIDLIGSLLNVAGNLIINDINDDISAIVDKIIDNNAITFDDAKNNAPTQIIDTASNANLVDWTTNNDSQAAADNRYVLSDTTSDTTNSLFGNISETNSQLDPTNTGVYKDTGYVKKMITNFHNIVESDIFKFLISLDTSNNLGSLKTKIESLYNNRQVINKILWDYAHEIDWRTDNQKVAVNAFGSSYISMALNNKTVVNSIEKAVPFFDTSVDGNLTLTKLFTNGTDEITQYAQVQLFKQNLETWLKTNFSGSTLAAILSEMVSKITDAPKNISGIFNIEIQGIENGLYGIGLGEFFLLIGMFVGTLMQTFVYDRAKRSKKANAIQYYLGKVTLMMITGFLQVTLLTLAVVAAGWWVLGAGTILLLWLWLLAIEATFVAIISSLWFSLKDETVGKFVVVVYMVLNLASGWGTFPAFMQFGFFDFVSNIVPFTYALHGIGSIVYGIGSIGINLADTLYILMQWGILWIFFAVFISLGIGMSILRNREILFGSYKAKWIIDGLTALNMGKELNEFKLDNHKYNWKSLGNDWNKDLYWKVRELHPFEGKFKWFKNKVREPELKPNYSDDDIISRNE
ncbi:ABC transporter permease [Spiroplasma endosymbiont of Labia minor]|uniref:ABC transporter permease n=1 Tax=Spiroplasma endosymbiont of Labia minor TaxID=3066305 RepID=UPI0030CC7E28